MPRSPDPARRGMGALIRTEANQYMHSFGSVWAVALLVTLDNCYRSQSALRRRRVLQMSALSTFDGR